ncbi:hypothetical protein [Vibrio parahaemolyticus]|uniref:hypothetical protein n=1 Tax=Vibrio parahaemolyticus TaxID=670 RepID=UPI002269F951|nr:hypothetical protein [Vibrio parahaemolyticus]MCX8796138.1 hypothetical protein [Vibrio parahaemolyticus]
MTAKYATVIEVNKIAAIAAMIDNKATVEILPTLNGQLEVLINKVQFAIFDMYTDACGYITQLANDGLSEEQESLLAKHQDPVFFKGKNGVLVDFEEIEPFLSSMQENLSHTAARYHALICFDMSKRKINRSNQKHLFLISGDNLAHALEEFKSTDESSGLVESEHSNDFGGEVMTVIFECEA